MPNWDDTATIAQIPCPLCENNVHRRIVGTVWDAPESAVYQCSECDIVFIHPIMSPEEEKAFYEAEFSRYMKQRGAPGETLPAEHFEKNREEAQRRSRLLTPYLRKAMHVLEVGSSTGFLLAEIEAHVSTVIGIEPNLLYAEYARSRGIDTCGGLNELAGESFDLILGYYVLEHLRDPVAYLGQLHSLLKPGGLLALEVPNVDDALVSLYQLESFDRFYWQKAHYFYYSHRTLSSVLARAGFDSIKMIPEHRYDFSNHLHWMLKGQPGGKGKYRHIFKENLDRAYADCLKAQWLCDTVFAFASRRDEHIPKNPI